MGKVGWVLGGLRRMQPTSEEALKAIDNCWVYLSEHRGRTHYRKFRRGGYPLGSGGQGHSVLGHGVAQQVQDELKGFVLCGALLPRHAPYKPKPFLKVDSHDSTAEASHRGLCRDTGLSPPSGHTPSLSGHFLFGLLCHVMWLPQL